MFAHSLSGGRLACFHFIITNNPASASAPRGRVAVLGCRGLVLSCFGRASGLDPRDLGGEQGELCTSRYCLKQVCLQSQTFLGVQPFLLLQKPPEYSACRPGPLVMTRGSSLGNETPVWSACLGRAGAGWEVEVPELCRRCSWGEATPAEGESRLGGASPAFLPAPPPDGGSCKQ